MKIDILVKDYEISQHKSSARTEHLTNSNIFVTIQTDEHLRKIIEQDLELSENIYHGNARVRFVYPTSTNLD